MVASLRSHLGLIAIGLAVLADSQVAAQAPIRPYRESVTLVVDNDAAKLLLSIEDRWNAGRIPEAIESIVELCESHGDSIVQQESGVAGGIARYTQVRAACEELLAGLSDADLRHYRELVDPRAARLWEHWKSTGDAAALHQLEQHDFFSSFGDDALVELASLAWQRGEISQARRYWSSLLPPTDVDQKVPGRQFPDADMSSADVAARLVLCDLFDQRHDEARYSLGEFSRRFPDARGSLAGEEGLWTELLTRQFRAADQQSQFAPGDQIPTFAGSNQRRSRSLKPIDLGSELWSVSFDVLRLPETPRATLFPTQSPLAFHPAIVDDLVFLNDGQRIHAWRLPSGRPAFDSREEGSAVIYPLIDLQEQLPPRRAVVGAPQWSVSIDAGRLFARMGSPVTAASPLEMRDVPTQLICLDIARGEGRLLWSLTGEELTRRLQPADADVQSWGCEGTPLALEGRVYAVLSRRRPQLEWSVVCLDAESGIVLWHRTTGMSRPTPAEHENLASQLLLTAGPDRLYLSTDWGAIIALDRATGQQTWAVTYESDPVQARAGEPLSRQSGCPCLYVDGEVFAAPADSTHVYCLDGTTGRLKWQQRTLPRTRHLLGVEGGKLFASGSALVALDVETGRPIWMHRPSLPEESGYGRGWLAGDVIYWPTRQALQMIDQDSGAVRRDHPLTTVDSSRSGGNVIVANGITLIAGPDRLTAYGEYSRLKRQGLHWLSQVPGDARPQLRLAELDLQQQDTTAAVERWQSILSRQSGRPEEFASIAEARLVGELLREARQAPQPARRKELLQQAKEAAVSETWQRAILIEDHRLAASQDSRMLTALALVQHRELHPAITLADEPTVDDLEQSLGHPLERHPVVSRTVSSRTVTNQTRPPSHFDHADPGGNPAPSVQRDFWKRVWQRILKPGERAIVPQTEPDSQRVTVVLVEGQDLTAVASTTGATLWSVALDHPVIWAGEDAEKLLLVTAGELLAVETDSGKFLWRLPRSPGESNRRPWIALGLSSLLVAEPAGFTRLIGQRSGDVRWQSQSLISPDLSTASLHDRWLFEQSQPAGYWELRELRSGRILGRQPSPPNGWLRPPAWSLRDELALVDGDRRLRVYSTSGKPLYELGVALSHAHADPWVFEHAGVWFGVIDGLRLVCFGPERRPVWSSALAPSPLVDPSRQLGIVEDVLIACGGGTARGINLDDGHVVWERPWSLTAVGQVWSLEVVESASPQVLLTPEATGVNTLMMCSSRTGALRQQIALLDLDRSTQIRPHADGVLIAGPRELLALAPR